MTPNNHHKTGPSLHVDGKGAGTERGAKGKRKGEGRE